jgi:formate-dependent nitrite reductase membrane component NrfD
MVYDLFHFDLFSDVVPITLMALSVTLVTGAWWTTFKIHKSIHILFENRQIEKLEKGSPLDQVLEKFSALMAVLSFVFFGFMLGLVATFLFLGSKH